MSARRRARDRWTAAARCTALLGLLAPGCRTSGASSEPPSDAVAAAPTTPGSEGPASSGAPTEAAPDPHAEGYLAEARWNAEASEGSEPEPPPEPTPAERYGRPTQEEFEAWDRKDPAADKHLYEWDRNNYARLQPYIHDLECLRARMVAAGEAGAGTKPGSAKAEAWLRAKRALILELDRWQKDLLVMEPRIFEKSKAIGMLLEAHELVMHALPHAYDDADTNAIQKAAAHWMIVEAKLDTYAQRLGHSPTRASDAHCKAMGGP